jgi:hypothetical protein
MPVDIASTHAQRISELNTRITSAQSRVPADGQERVSIATQVATWNDEVSVLSGNRPLSAGAKPEFPQPK